MIYSDAGIPPGADVWTWDGTPWSLPSGAFDSASRDCNGAPEGSTCFKTTSGANSATATNYAGWGVIAVSNKNWDLSACNRLLFCAQVDGAVATLKVEIQDASSTGAKYTARPGIASSGWQLIAITKDQFGSASLANIFGPFYVTVEDGGQTFRIDNVRWDNGSGSVADSCHSQGAGGTGGPGGAGATGGSGGTGGIGSAGGTGGMGGTGSGSGGAAGSPTGSASSAAGAQVAGGTSG